MTKETQAEVAARYAALIPEAIRYKFRHLTYGGMAEMPECAEWADDLRQLEEDWFNAGDAE